MNRWLATLSIVLAGAVACTNNRLPTEPSASSASRMSTSSSGASAATLTPMSNSNGVGGSMPAYYDGELFTINFMELPPGGESANLAQNGSINTIYMSEGCKPGGDMFVSVLDAIQGDGFNPLWREVQVKFIKPTDCKQLKSDNEILSAAAAKVVTLQTTDELYRCSVIGKK